ncbi:CATRA conflict system CASPASE/TPR repeat-associated protein [Streptomyces sp. FZ201]|uniref:CATRA conflict system CASPASE/TPR repeat-associated protein n=1 Tax=Streptomyces sp. FZ201 TaxID=3057122 RepID=UPI0021BEE396|nr:CATRA conflict system CASPASE/TPR repeat-associated protein [Streptomyces sp. FZ201]
MNARVTKPALAVLCFVPATAQAAPASHQYLAALWQACRHLGMTAPLAGLPVPSPALPEVPAHSSDFRVLAAATRPVPGQVYSVYVFAHHDMAGLVALLAPNTADASLNQWADLYTDWNRAVSATGSPPATGVLGEYMVFEAMHRRGFPRGTRRLCAAVRDHAPVTGGGSWWKGFDHTGDGFSVWTTGPSDPSAVRRAHYVLASDRLEERLDAWVWAVDGFHGLRPLARYLSHVARLRYAAERYSALDAVHTSIEATDRQAQELLRHLRMNDPGSDVPLRRVLRAAALLDRSRLNPDGLLWRSTRLRQLARTLATISGNIVRTSPSSVRRGAGISMPDQDLAVARGVLAQVEDDLVHLDAAKERTDAVRALATSTIDQVMQTRGNRLSLLQTSALGGIVMALTAIQAFDYRVPLPLRLQAPLIAVLTALAVALPFGILRWAGITSRNSPYRWVDTPAGACLGASVGWLGVTVAYHPYAAPGSALVCSVAGGALVVAAGTWLLSRRHRPE